MPEIRHAGQVAGTIWNPGQYLKFSDYRLRPAIELLERVSLESPAVVYDLGCGTGRITRIIADRWPSAKVVGLDHSREMLREASAEPTPVQWIEADIETWKPNEAANLIYSNATLHWVPGHGELIPRLAGFVKPGGCLAIQMPLSWDLVSHQLMRKTLADGGEAGRPLGAPELRRAVARRWVEAADFYYDILAGHVRRLNIWSTEYVHELEGVDPVLEWVKGSGLRPILNGLADDERGIFLETYRRQLREAYPVKPNGRTLYPFRRLFIIALL